MRQISVLHPTDFIPSPADYVQTLLIAGSSGQAFDWPGSSQTLPNSEDPHIVRFTGQSTAGVMMVFSANLQSTGCSVPTTANGTGGLTTASSLSHALVIGQGSFQVPGNSTGGSVAALTSGYISIEMWRK